MCFCFVVLYFVLRKNLLTVWTWGVVILGRRRGISRWRYGGFGLGSEGQRWDEGEESVLRKSVSDIEIP